MVDNLFKRMAFAFVFFWLGIHGVGLGLKWNGFDSPWNPAWRLLSGIFQAEIFMLTILFWMGVVAASIAGIGLVFRCFKPASRDTIDIQTLQPRHKVEWPEPSFRESGAINSNEDDSTSTVIVTDPKPVMIPPKPEIIASTAEEKKREAIKQIIRGL